MHVNETDSPSADGAPAQVIVRLPRALLHSVDELRDGETRASTLRRLLRLGLRAAQEAR